jgi:hypothetical protein
LSQGVQDQPGQHNEIQVSKKQKNKSREREERCGGQGEVVILKRFGCADFIVILFFLKLRDI